MTFPEALIAKLNAISELTAIVGSSIFPGTLPETQDLGRDGPAVTYTITSYPRGHVLTGSDGTATARIQISAWAYSEAVSDSIVLALWNAVDGLPVNPWGDGSVQILSVVQKNEVDLPEEPRAGMDQWIYQIACEYEVKHRVSIPTLS